jgi:hypothetical protein
MIDEERRGRRVLYATRRVEVSTGVARRRHPAWRPPQKLARARKTCRLPLEPPGIRLVLVERKTTNRPSALIAGGVNVFPLLGPPSKATEIIWITPIPGGGRGVTVNLSSLEGPPPGAGFTTRTRNVPVFAKCVPSSCARSGGAAARGGSETGGAGATCCSGAAGGGAASAFNGGAEGSGFAGAAGSAAGAAPPAAHFSSSASFCSSSYTRLVSVRCVLCRRFSSSARTRCARTNAPIASAGTTRRKKIARMARSNSIAADATPSRAG